MKKEKTNICFIYIRASLLTKEIAWNAHYTMIFFFRDFLFWRKNWTKVQESGRISVCVLIVFTDSLKISQNTKVFFFIQSYLFESFLFGKSIKIHFKQFNKLIRPITKINNKLRCKGLFRKLWLCFNKELYWIFKVLKRLGLGQLREVFYVQTISLVFENFIKTKVLVLEKILQNSQKIAFFSLEELQKAVLR